MPLTLASKPAIRNCKAALPRLEWYNGKYRAMPHVPAKPFLVPNTTPPFPRPSGAPNVLTGRERRRRPRVLLELPVRVRWLGPFGLETEITQTENVSRDGLLISSFTARQPGSQLWATFPYDAAVAFTESETPGTVARCVPESANKNMIAISFHQNDPISQTSTPKSDSPGFAKSPDRRGHTRIPLAYLIRVSRIAPTRQDPQAASEPPQRPEETMTVNVSPVGMAFCTLHIYLPNERLTIAVSATRNLSDGKRYARVVRVTPVHPDSPLSHVAVEFLL